MAEPDPIIPSAPEQQLSLIDSTSIILGIIIGSGLYALPPTVASNVATPLQFLGVWALGGLLAFVGAICYAELATAWPQEGGDYAYLTRAFGRPVGFVFAWAQLWVVRPGSVGVLAFVFAEYASQLWPLLGTRQALTAAAVIAAMTLINILGVRQGKWTQNLLTAGKMLGLLVVLWAGFSFTSPVAESLPTAPLDEKASIAVALILVMFTYSGWNEMAYVAAEVSDPQRNILRALLLGTGMVTLIYLLVNAAFLHSLGLQGLRNSKAVAADTVALGLGNGGRQLLSGLICVSALGAINGMIFTGARIFYALGTEHRLFAPFGVWSSRFRTPARSLILQALVTIAVVLGFGLSAAESSGVQTLVNFTAPIFWLFLLLTGVSLFVLRRRFPGQRRPFRVPAYPLVPVVFCAGSLFMLYSTLDYAVKNRSLEALWAVGLFVLGCVLWRFERK